MAKLRMTYKNLKALRKSKEYQALLVDLVSVGVVPKATAEGLLGYNIPANLIIDDESSGTDNPVTDDDEGGSGSTDKDPVVTSKVTLLNFDGEEWLTAEYDLTDDPTGEGILTFAKDVFDYDALNTITVVELSPEYVEGETSLNNKYAPLDPQPEILESGMLVGVYYTNAAPGAGTQGTVVSGGGNSGTPPLDPSTSGGN